MLKLCIYRIETYRIKLGETRFKVGITHCPRWRFIDAPYAYVKEKPAWGVMQVLWVSDLVDFACDLETDLITHFKKQETKGRWNIRGGGDSPPKIAPCFVYCVFGFGPHGGSGRAPLPGRTLERKIEQRESLLRRTMEAPP